MNFSLLSSMDFPLHQISVGPDETRVIRETQVGHLRAITAQRELIVQRVRPAQRHCSEKSILVVPVLWVITQY